MRSIHSNMSQLVSIIFVGSLFATTSGCNQLRRINLVGYIQEPTATSYMIPRQWKASKPMPVIGIGAWREHAGENERSLTIDVLDDNGTVFSSSKVMIPAKHLMVDPYKLDSDNSTYHSTSMMSTPTQGEYAVVRFTITDEATSTVVRSSEKKVTLY